MVMVVMVMVGGVERSGSGMGFIDMGLAAARALSDTGLDVKAFGALAQIQIRASENGRVGIGAGVNRWVTAFWYFFTLTSFIGCSI